MGVAVAEAKRESAAPAEGEPAPAATTSASTEPAPTPKPPPAPPPEPEPDAEATWPAPRDGPYRVLLIGDSMAATDFGRELEKRLDQHADIDCRRKGKSATGLARPDFFNWTTEGAKQVKRAEPDLVIVVIGGNDGQDLITPNRKGRRVHWNGRRWQDAYRARVEAFVDLLTGAGRRVLWLELPVMDHRSLEKKLKTIRAVHREAIDAKSDVAWYVDTRRHFVGDDDRLLRKVRVKGYKKLQRLRQEDGIHFTVAGSRYFADAVYPEIVEILGLR